MSEAKNLHWTVDVTLNDVDAIVGFMEAQMPRSGIASLPQAHRTHHALRMAIDALHDHIKWQLGDKGIAHALKYAGWDLDRAQAISQHWSDLIAIASVWDDVEGYDHDRWVRRKARDTRKAEETPTEDAAASFAVSEYRIPRARDGAAEDIVVARSTEHPNSWGVFEGSTQGWHWDGSSWQHPSLSDSSPYLYTEQDALDAARRCAAAPRNPEGTDR